MPSTASAEPQHLFGHSFDAKDGGEYAFKWHREWSIVKKNHNGTTGWAQMVHSTNAAHPTGALCRIHICAHNPCSVIWPASKYGLAGPPLHVQEGPKPILSAVAGLAPVEPAPAEPEAALEEPEAALEEPDAAVEEPEAAVAEIPVPAEPPPAELAPVPAEVPAEAPAPVVKPDVLVGPIHVPDSPKTAALQSMKPPAPATPIDVSADGDINDTAVAATGGVSKAVAAGRKIVATLLALARAIRVPRTYVGYSAFVVMGLRMKCRPCAWEGSVFIDLLDLFAPWAKESCTRELSVAAIPCALMPKPGGSVECVPISDEHPVSQTRHFVGGLKVDAAAVAGDTCGFEMYYAKLGVATLATVCDGGCGVDVMSMMLGQPSSFASRKELRIEISDYLMSRINEPWMQDLMALCQEVDNDDVILSRSEGAQIVAIPKAPAPAVAEPAIMDVVVPDENTIEAMRWASQIQDTQHFLSLVRSLPKEIVEEQVRLYGDRAGTAVAEAGAASSKIIVSALPKLRVRMLVAKRFHMYCLKHGIVPDKRMPYGAVKAFIHDNLEWKSGRMGLGQTGQLRKWHASWQASSFNVLAAVADKPKALRDEKKSGHSRSKLPLHQRVRAPGGGKQFKAPLVRKALYEWWSGMRFAIDWKKLAEDRRHRGRKCLARFPRSALKLKVAQLLEDYAYSCLLNGSRVVAFLPDAHWFRRWEEDHGLSMRKANRKYQVPRPVLKERMEIFWVVLFRIRLFIALVFGYDPMIQNFDQSPFHHNETGSQDKPVLCVRGSKVPIIEGNADVRTRWTGTFTTCSRAAVAVGSLTPVECMFKAEKDGSVDARLQAFLRSRGFPSWFTVTVGPKGSYREHDIIAFLRKHLEPWTEGRDWRIMLADDYSAHKTENVSALCWSRGYILLTHGGGASSVAQTPDTDLNQFVRREYGNKESRLLLEKMRLGEVVPKLTNEECMVLMLEILSDPDLHKHASEGYKKVGQSIDLHGKEDALICREAGVFWNEVTTDKYPSMRPKINAELAAVAEEFESGGLPWTRKSVQRLITPYPTRKDVDRILANLGDDFFHDDLEELEDGGEDAAVAEGEDDSSSHGSDEDAIGHVDAAVAGDGEEPSRAQGPEIAELETKGLEIMPLSAAQADAVHQAQSTIAALEASLESLRAVGLVRGAQMLEFELSKQRRRVRELVQDSPAVADAFSRLRRAEEEDALVKTRLAAQQNERKREAAKAIADRDAAVADLKRTRKAIQDMEGTLASKHAIKSFTLEALGTGSPNAGGAKSKKSRFEVLDRLARLNAGLSAGQKNDWQWFKDAWDSQMVTQHKAKWADVFSGWVQGVLNDERSNAFSCFVHSETCRVFAGTAALQVPG